ncbi:MAG: amidohydrolase family protein [Gemmatimonadetes bacterium]|nr:amidohydrolase family protein [Gemmatimonadota bacterium]
MTGVARRFTAGWVVPMDAPPIAGGAVLVGPDGRIAAVGPAATVPLPPGVPEEACPGMVLLPGFINVHTHLELTGLDGQVPEADFPAWIRHIIALKAGRTPADFLAAARRGLQDCWAAGVTTVADTGDSGAVIQALAEAGGSGIAYHEVFGPHPAQADEAIADAARRLDELAPFTSERVRLGLSPHAPYSVSGALYAHAARLATARDLPLAVHLAESADESLLLAEATGGFARAWEGRGIPLPPLPGRTPVAWLDQHGVLGSRTLCIHLVRVSAEDVTRLARAAVAAAHCPRSNARHGHGAAPLQALLGAGIRVGVGTDSVASVAPLDLLAEARAARALAGLGAEAALRLITTGAACALGLEREVGSLTPGHWGDLVAARLPADADPSRIPEAVLSLGRDAIFLTCLAGRPRYRGERL